MRSFVFGALTAIALVGAGPASAQDECREFACEQTFDEVGLPSFRGEQDCADFAPRCLTNFALLHNNTTKVPDWVIELLNSRNVKGPAKRKNDFHHDKEIQPEGTHSELSDYEGSRYDRGHQAPAGDNKQNQTVMSESFLLSNMAPQVGLGFNRAKWSYLEEAVRGWILCGGHDQLFVMTGPIYDREPPRTTKPSSTVAVPDAFFKIIYDPDQERAIAFRLKNQKYTGKDLDKFRVSIDEIEDATGYEFLTALPRRKQSVIKRSVSPMWGYDKSCNTRE